MDEFRIDRPTCVFWFLHFAGMGLVFPYMSLYLRENGGLSPSQVGLVLAVPPLVGLLALPGWGQVADRTGGRSRVLTWLAFGAAISLSVFGQLRGVWALLLGIAFVAAFHRPIVPSITAVTLAGLEAGKRHWYGVVRAFGTLGFALLVVGFPPLLAMLQESRGWDSDGASEPGLSLIFLLAGGFSLLAAITGLLLPRTGAVALRAERGSWRALLRHGPYLRLLAVMFTAFFLQQGPMEFFPIYLRSLGGSLADVGLAWIWMLMLEIPLLVWAGVHAARRDPRTLLFVGLLAGGMRWLCCAFVEDLSLALPLQLLHGLLVAGMITGGPLYVDAAVPRELRSTAQGLHGLLGAGLGGALSAVICGRLIEHFDVRTPYWISGVGTLLLAALLFAILPPPRRPPTPGEGAAEAA